MRVARRRQPEFRQLATEDIRSRLDSRDDIPETLQGVKDLCPDPEFREHVFKLLDETLLPDADRHQGRPGTDLRSIPAPGVVKQAKRMDFDTLREQANERETLRMFLGTADPRDNR